MASAPQRLKGVPLWWCVAAVALVALHAALAYGHLRRLDAWHDDAVGARIALVNRAVALHTALGLSSLVLLVIAAERIAREKQLRRQLQDVTKWHRATLASVRDRVIGVDANGQVTFANDKAVRDIERPDSDLIGQPIADVLPIVDAETHLPADNPALRALRERRAVEESRSLALVHDGSHTSVEATALPILSSDDDVAGALLVVRDASDGARAERLTEPSHTAFKSVLDALPTQVALLNERGVIVETNAAWRRFASTAVATGHECGVGSNYSEAYQDDSPDAADIAAGVQAVVHGERASYTSEHQYADTPPVWLQMHVAALDGESDVKAVVAHEDVSTRMVSEARMQKQSDQLRRLATIANAVSGAQDVGAVMETVTAGAGELVDADLVAAHVLIGGANGLELDIEAGASQGYRPVTRSGPSPWRTAPCGALTDTACMTRAELDANAEWRTFLGGIGYENAPGGWLGTPLLGLDGRYLGDLHVLGRTDAFTEQDVSVITQMARLASGAIENAWLYEELREGDRRKDEFLATLAHELRNPLAPMRSAIEIIKRAPDDTARRSATAVLERQVLQMVRLIDDLLDISRITRSKLDLRCTLVDLAGVIRDAAEASRPAIDKGEHRLVLALPLQPVTIRADHARLSQVFANLLHNAAKYSEPRGTIEVSLESSAREAVVRVRDTGIGIAPDLLPHVFDMFVQADQPLDRGSGGLGIGLALVRSIVELHGGRVEAASPGVGQGSCFTVRLPMNKAAAAAPAGATDTPRQTPKPRRILVVDDNADAVDSLATLLRLEGHDVQVARDGLAAVQLARSFEPDLALLDIGLPGMSGYDVARALRADTRTRRCVLVALSGWGQEADRQQSREAGFDRHLVKPLDISMLNEILTRTLAPVRAAEDAVDTRGE